MERSLQVGQRKPLRLLNCLTSPLGTTKTDNLRLQCVLLRARNTPQAIKPLLLAFRHYLRYLDGTGHRGGLPASHARGYPRLPLLRSGSGEFGKGISDRRRVMRFLATRREVAEKRYCSCFV
jgi:hypothetical protein